MHELNQIEDLRVAKDVKRMAVLSSAKATDSIAVVGPQSLEYMVALFRSGFERAACVMGSRACGEPIKHLFVSSLMGNDQLALVVASIGRQLDLDGTIVAPLRDRGQDQVISSALKGVGIVELPPVFEGSGHLLVGHHLRPPNRLAIAA